MSGGAILVVPAVLIVPLAAVAAGAGLAAVLVVRASQAGTEATGRALERFADEMERRADAQDDREIRTRLWEVAAGAVVPVNRDLRLLAARAAKVGVRPALPAPIDLDGCRLADIRAIVARSWDALAAARVMVEDAEAAQERQTLMARLSVRVTDSPTAAELLARHQKVLDARRQRSAVGSAPAAPVHVDESRVRAEIDEVLLRLDVDATPTDREEALLAADRAARQRGVGMARTYLSALARIVDKEINPRVARRREAADLLVGLEHPLVSEMIGDLAPPRPPCLASIERLRAVVRGEADLTGDDRRAARSALIWAQQELERRRLLDAVAETFAELGYAVTTGMQVYDSTALSVTRRAWRGDHTADVWVDEAGRVRSRLIQRAPGADGEAVRCADLNGSMRRVGDDLTRRGLGADVRVPETPMKALVVRSGTDYGHCEDDIPMAKSIDREVDE